MHEFRFSAFLADGSPAGPTQNPIVGFVLPIVLMGAIFYVLAIRPQQQRAKQQAKLLAALKAGDRIVTSAGIIGTVVTVKDKAVTVRSGDAKFEVTKASVTDIIVEDAASTPSAS